MPNQSTAYILVKDYSLTYHFTGMISITHSFSLKISDQSDMTEAGAYVNGAKNQPDSVTLSVVETDAAHDAQGWAERMLDVLSAVKRRRLLCRVVTPHHTYDNMLLSSVSATQNESSPDGWSGEITFTECLSVAQGSAAKANDNASKATNTGSAAPAKTVSGNAAVSVVQGIAAGAMGAATAAVQSGSTLAQKLSGGGFNPGQVKIVYCVE